MGFVEIGDQITRVEKILQFGQFTTDEIAALPVVNGAIIINSDDGNVCVGANDTWNVLTDFGE